MTQKELVQYYEQQLEKVAAFHGREGDWKGADYVNFAQRQLDAARNGLNPFTLNTDISCLE